jgi:hypothetical protein
MRKSRFTEAQIVAIIRELEAGRAATELARKHGVCQSSHPDFRSSAMIERILESPSKRGSVRAIASSPIL